MRFKVRLGAFFFLFAVLAGPVAAKPMVIVLSWDGMRHDFPDKGNYTGLSRLEKEGIRATRLIAVYPSATFPGHVSLATGAPPSIHGIVDNNFFDREKGKYAYESEANWIVAEPVWVAAERQHVRAAVYFWVGSETDWRGQRATYRIAPFDGFRSEEKKVSQIIDWIDLPEDERPQLIMSYWSGADGTAHLKGPDHPDVADAISEQDENLLRLLDAIDQRDLWRSTTLIVVSDHGMTNVNQSVEIKTPIESSNLGVRVFGGNAVQRLFVDDLSHMDSVLKILAAEEHIVTYAGEDIPEQLRYKNRTGDIVITTHPPYTLSRSSSLLDKATDILAGMMGWNSGAHGYDPALPDMGGIFFAIGRGVDPAINLGEVRQLDVAPTIAELLEIDPPLDSIGTPIKLGDTSIKTR